MLQLFMVAVGVAGLLAVLNVILEGLSVRVETLCGGQRWLVAVTAGATTAAYCVIVMSHDMFVIEIYSLMAEAPHLLPTAAALVLLVHGLVAKSHRRSLIMLLLAAAASYLSTMVKPHSTFTLVFCLATLLVASLRTATPFDHRPFSRSGSPVSC